MWLEAVDGQKEDVREEDVESLTAQDGNAESKGQTDLIDEWVEQEAWEGRGEVEMPRRSAPVGRLLFDNVVDEAGQLGPEGPALPEVAVDRDCEGETNERAQEAGWND